MDFSVYFFSADDECDAGSRYRFILDVARFIDGRGFSAIWTPERHFERFGGSFPNPSVLSAALAASTEQVGLRAGSVVLPHHHPVRIVEEWALVDQLSGGRVGLCMATGWHKGDFVFYPERYEGRREFTFTEVDTVRRLWRGEAVSFPGPGGETLPIVTYPRPKQPEVPLWLVHSSNPDTWTRAAELGAGVLTLLDSWDRLAKNVAGYREAWARAGHTRAPGTVTVGLHAYVGEDEEEVRRLVAGPVRRYLDTFLLQKQRDASVHGSSHQMSAEEKEMLAKLAAEDFYERRSLLGTPDKCAAIVERLASVGVDEIACLVDFGLPFDVVLEGLHALDDLRRRFAAPATVAPPPSAGEADGARDVAPSEAIAWYYDR